MPAGDSPEDVREAPEAPPLVPGDPVGPQALFVVDAAARPRRAPPRRGRESSDLTRGRGVLLSLAVGAGAAGAGAAWLPPTGGHIATGPISRPHARARVTCEKCHAPAEEDRYSAAVAGRACARCHAEHGSTRRGHAALLEAGKLGCPRCHGVHREGEGLSFAPGKATIHFGAGVEEEVEGGAFSAGHPATVALVRAAACAGCHELASRSDPAARCFSGAGDGREIVRCLDEHRPALRDSPPTGSAPGAVCADQHGPDRPLYWEAALAVAASLQPAQTLRSPARGLAWMGLGLGAFGLSLTAARLAARLRRRTRVAAAPTVSPKAGAPQQAPGAPSARLPVIEASTCLGCYACVDACPYAVLEIDRYVARVARPEACCGLVLCEQRCPNGSLRVSGEAERPEGLRLDQGLQSAEVPGLWLAGDVTGVPLIKNAILQGERAMRSIAVDLSDAADGGRGDELDVVVVGAGPAGISAALAAKELGLSCEVLEQATVAQSIRSFPRGKLVFDQPLELPHTGKLWLRESTKEELLSNWLRIVREARLAIHEGTRFVGATRQGVLFVLRVVDDQGRTRALRARRLLVAIGQRGTPRRLSVPIPEELESRVHYHLADARSFQGRRVVVVGLGDVALEAAVALARQPGTRVTLLARGETFRRGSARNIDEVKRLARAGSLELRFRAEVDQVAPTLRVRVAGAAVDLDWDALFVLIGSLPPRELLRGLGVEVPESEALE